MSTWAAQNPGHKADPSQSDGRTHLTVGLVVRARPTPSGHASELRTWRHPGGGGLLVPDWRASGYTGY